MLFDTSNPQAAAQFGLGVEMAGGVMSVIGAFAGAQAQRSQLEFQADIARVNAAIAESNARTALQVGQREVQASQLRTAGLKASQEAGMAANGVDIGEGSAARVRTSTDYMGQVDANTIAANAVRAAWGYRTQGSNFGIEAAMKDAAAGAVSPWMAGGSTLLTSAGHVASGWYALSRGAGGPWLDTVRGDRGGNG